jgi:hypothetical protein
MKTDQLELELDDYTISLDLSDLDLNNTMVLTPTISTIDTITISPGNITSGAYTIGAAGTGANGYVYTTNATGNFSWQASNSPMTVDQSGTIELSGYNSHIKIYGSSLLDRIKSIESRLNILRPDHELEKEWDELRELGNKYRELEKHITEKMDTWNKIKAMNPPDLG